MKLNLRSVKKPVWISGILGTILGIVGAIASIYSVWPFWIPEKQLTISVVSIGAQLPTTLDSDFEVSYQGNKVGNIATFLVDIRNSGSEEIRPDDFVKPLTFPITGVDEIFSVEQVKLQPESQVQFDFEPISSEVSSVVLKPVLLNKDDSGRILIRASCDRIPKLTIEAKARIAGISKLNFQDERPKPSFLQIYTPLISVVTILLLIAIVLGQSFINSRTEQKLKIVRQDTKRALWSDAVSKLRVISYELEKENLSGLATLERVNEKLRAIFEDENESGRV